MTKHVWCPNCNSRILTIEEELLGMCNTCSQKHAEEFHEKYDINDE